MPHARTSCWSHALRLALSSLCAACVGTPTPEPPDYGPLPRPRGDDFLSSVRVLSEDVDDLALPPVTVPLTAAAGAVPASSDVWIVNLDEPASAPIMVRADARGGFSLSVTGRIGQRLRVYYVVDARHSLPLDLRITGNAMGAGVTLLPRGTTALEECVHITPEEELIASGRVSSRQTFTVENRCAGDVELTRAELRFGDRGFRLTTPPDGVPANAQAELVITVPAHDDTNERGDIVLLELASGDEQASYALGVWASGTGSE